MVQGIEPLRTDIDDFSEAIYCRSYRLLNSPQYLDRHTDPALHKLKHQIDFIYSTLDIFDGKGPMETFGFIATIRDGFEDHNM